MRKPLNRSPFASGTINRFGRSKLGGGLATTNSNARISVPPAMSRAQTGPGTADLANLGLNSERLRQAMVQRLRLQGIQNETVLDAMAKVPRHLFVDEGLSSRAYEDVALPIGFGQTISQPWVVARMICAICENGAPANVLEVGAGCGYQAAVLAQIIRQVYAMERVRGLYDMARQHLRQVGLAPRVRLVHGDGMLGLPAHAPFGAIIVAAAGLSIPQALLDQLAPGGRLIAPVGSGSQRLVLVERTGPSTWHRTELEAVRFVPLRAGTQS